MEKLEHLYIAGGNVKGSVTVEIVWQFLKTLNIELPYDPAMSLLSICPKELKAGISNTYLYTNVHSNIIHNSQKVEMCLPTYEWINNMQ